MIRISAMAWVPPFVRGYVRDLRVRWALEEAGLPYTARLIDPRAKRDAEYLGWQPFGQVPAFEQDGVCLFESGAIVLHIAEGCEALLPAAPEPRARAIGWLFAALNTIEPPLQAHAENEWFQPDETARAVRRPQLRAAMEKRLAPLAERLATRDWLEDRFTCADLMMATVLRIADDTDLLSGNPLAAYLERCTARPAYARAMAAHLADFADEDEAS